VGWNITTLPEAYAPVADFLSEQARKAPAQGFARITQSFRARYYQIAKRVLFERRQVIDCYASWASVHLAPNGDVWSCCIRAEPMGNLRAVNYDFDAIWRSPEMQAMRQSIYNRECACPMANATYANMILHPPTVAGVVKDLILPR
jgi:MoaA/NifB/PqqE/SkfB family radical SAM enzyme